MRERERRKREQREQRESNGAERKREIFDLIQS